MKHRKHGKHYRYRNRHHLVARARGGRGQEWNLLLIQEERHELWHRIFGLRDLDEIIQLLIRLKRIKDFKKGAK